MYARFVVPDTHLDGDSDNDNVRAVLAFPAIPDSSVPPFFCALLETADDGRRRVRCGPADVRVAGGLCLLDQFDLGGRPLDGPGAFALGAAVRGVAAACFGQLPFGFGQVDLVG